MKKSSTLIMVSGLAAALQVASAADITGTITLKGTPPKEKDITPVMEDANCSKLHTKVPTTRFYVVGPKGELADVVVSLQGISGKSTGASAPPVVLDQKGCEYIPSIFAVQTDQKIIVKNSDPVLHNVHDVPGEGSGNKEKNEAQLPNGPDLTFSFSKPENFLKFKCDVHQWMFAWVQHLRSSLLRRLRQGWHVQDRQCPARQIQDPGRPSQSGRGDPGSRSQGRRTRQGRFHAGSQVARPQCFWAPQDSRIKQPPRRRSAAAALFMPRRLMLQR